MNFVLATTGFYTLMDRDGRLRRVEYTAGPEGFKVSVLCGAGTPIP